MRSGGSSSGVSSLLRKFDLRLEVWRGVKVSARFPGALSLYEIHTDSDRVVCLVDGDGFGRVGKAAFSGLPRASGTLKFPTYLEVNMRILRGRRQGSGCDGGRADLVDPARTR